MGYETNDPNGSKQHTEDASKVPKNDANGKGGAQGQNDGKPGIPESVTPIELLESVSGGRGAQTSVSVLEPTMWIERTDSKTNPEFKIVAYFQLQVKVNAFDKGQVY